VLQPLVENATRHALQEGRPCEIDVRARSVNGSLELTVEDDGPGFDRFPPQEGIGLKSVRVRLATLFGSGASLEYANRERGGARVTLRVPRMTSANGSGDELAQR
jgi:LytS/YehU family sensor histidine kinase